MPQRVVTPWHPRRRQLPLLAVRKDLVHRPRPIRQSLHGVVTVFECYS
jgi:hypothetical protein